MGKRPKLDVPIEDVLALALFAQRSTNAEFREHSFAFALAALGGGAPDLTKLRPLCEFAARTKAKSPSAERAREVALRLLRETGHAELWAQLARSTKPR